MSSDEIPLHQRPKLGPSIAVEKFGHGVFSASYSSTIKATPVACLEATLDTQNFPNWNTYIVKLTIDTDVDPIVPADAPPLPEELEKLKSRPGYLTLGTPATYHSVQDPAKPEKYNSGQLYVTQLGKTTRNGRPGYRIAWSGRGTPYFFLHFERVQEFIVSEDGNQTEYYCWETFGGLAAYLIYYTSIGTQLVAGLGRYMDGLKSWVESR